MCISTQLFSCFWQWNAKIRPGFVVLAITLRKSEEWHYRLIRSPTHRTHDHFFVYHWSSPDRWVLHLERHRLIIGWTNVLWRWSQLLLCLPEPSRQECRSCIYLFTLYIYINIWWLSSSLIVFSYFRLSISAPDKSWCHCYK